MEPTIAVFTSSDDAAWAAGRLKILLSSDQVRLLTPSGGPQALRSVPAVEDMPPVEAPMATLVIGTLAGVIGLLVAGAGRITPTSLAVGLACGALVGCLAGDSPGPAKRRGRGEFPSMSASCTRTRCARVAQC